MINGNMVGGTAPIKTVKIVDENGNEILGVVTESEVVFTATDNDVREGMVYASNDGVSTGTKNIPAYHTTEGIKIITAGSKFQIELKDTNGLDRYDYTKLQAIVCDFNTNLQNSVAAIKTSINNNVYEVNSTSAISAVTKLSESQTIDLGITNATNLPKILRYFTYKEIE